MTVKQHPLEIPDHVREPARQYLHAVRDNPDNDRLDGKLTTRKAYKMTKSAFQFKAKVGPGGKLEISVPLPLGTTVEVLVLAPNADEFADLVEAAASSIDFWYNPLDDEDWNNA